VRLCRMVSLAAHLRFRSIRETNGGLTPCRTSPDHPATCPHPVYQRPLHGRSLQILLLQPRKGPQMGFELDVRHDGLFRNIPSTVVPDDK